MPRTPAETSAASLSFRASGYKLSFSVELTSAGERLDRFLSARLPEISRSQVQVLISKGSIRLNGAVARKSSRRLDAGDTIRVEIPPPAPARVEPEDLPLEVLFEDEDVAVLNKPAGMIVHPGAGAHRGTLVAALEHRFGSALSSIGGPLRRGIVHRLDKDTSGAMVIARTDAAHLNLSRQFLERRVQKTYLALLHGELKGESGRIELPIARDLHRRSRMTTRRREGRASRTDWRVLLRLPGFTLAEARLHTGRTHQIRVHFAAMGCPVVGDTTYGAPRAERTHAGALPPMGRNFLHAARLAFGHPRDGRRIEVRAPLPPGLLRYLEMLAQMVAQGAAGRSRQPEPRAAALSTFDPASVDAALKSFL